MLNPESIRDELIPSYTAYCGEVSEPAHALSLETGTFLMWLCRTRKPVTVADYGSGWSSVVLRLYGQESGATVTSVDTDAVWLERTRTFLDGQNLDSGGLWLWDDYIRTHLVHDLILHDLANGTTREQTMVDAAERLIPGGVIVFDDAQHSSHHTAARQVCGRYGMRLMDVKELTVDRIGRFAAVAEKP